MRLGYLLTMPQTLQAGAEERFCLTLHGIAEDQVISLALYEPTADVSVEYKHTYINGESQCNTFQVPSQPGKYEVQLQNETDVFTVSEVEVQGKNLITFVQTDKPIYKPGQTGMASLEFQLIDEAKLGTWQIQLTVDGEKTTQTFEVQEYVLPRFEVIVEPPTYFLVTSEVIEGTVCANSCCNAKVETPGGSPAADEKIRISASDNHNNLYLEKIFTTNENGEIHYSVCQGLMENTTSLSLAVMSRGRIVYSGQEEAPAIPDPLSFLEPHVDSCLEVGEKPTYAPPLPPEPETTPSGNSIPPYGMGDDEPIVRSEEISDQVSSVQITIPVVAEMSPKFSLLVYYIRDDGETVADSMEFKVEACFDNEVKMEFSEKTVLPGAETKIQLEAAPGSVCGVGVVDKSVNILGGDHQITPEKVFEKLAEYSLSTRGGYRYFRSDNEYCEEKLKEKQEEEQDGEDEDEPRFFHDYWYRSNYVDAIQAFKVDEAKHFVFAQFRHFGRKEDGDSALAGWLF
nr:hypothetical protein BaRGS_035213 [Batillaria attramentaria]